MSKKDADDAVVDTRRSTTCNGNATLSTTTTTTTNGVASSSSPTSLTGVDPSAPDPSAAPSPPTPPCDPPDDHPHHPPYDLGSSSDPQPSLTPSSYHTPHRLSAQSVTSLTSSRPAPPSPAMSRRASGLSRTSSRPVSDMSSTSSRPASGAQHPRPLSGGGSRPASGTVQPTTPSATTMTTPTTTTPSSLRHTHDRPSNPVPTLLASEHDSFLTESTPVPAPATTTAMTAPALIHIRDYGFALTDPRFSGQGPYVPRPNRPSILACRLASSSGSTSTSLSEGDNGRDDDEYDYEDYDEEGEGRMDIAEVQRMWENIVDDGANGWSGFKWGSGRARGSVKSSGVMIDPSNGSPVADYPSRGDLDRNFGWEDEYDDMEIDEGATFSDEEGEGGAESEPPLFPGLYRALYAFEPEGTAEMRLHEDQFVRVVGRGGGVGWAVVVKDGLKDTGVHALVPESYLELVRLGVEEDA